MRSRIYDNPADDPEAEPFLKAIAAAPGDGIPRHIFSDWLEENGYENAAKGQRWAAKYNKFSLPADEARGVRGGYHYGGTRAPDNQEHYHLPEPFSYTIHRPTRSYPHPVLTRSGKDPVINELAFLDASHQLPWHPETGEPLVPGRKRGAYSPEDDGSGK